MQEGAPELLVDRSKIPDQVPQRDWWKVQVPVHRISLWRVFGWQSQSHQELMRALRIEMRRRRAKVLQIEILPVLVRGLRILPVLEPQRFLQNLQVMEHRIHQEWELALQTLLQLELQMLPMPERGPRILREPELGHQTLLELELGRRPRRRKYQEQVLGRHQEQAR